MNENILEEHGHYEGSTKVFEELENFDFDCKTDKDFSEKYLFLNTLLDLGVSNIGEYKNRLAPLTVPQEKALLSKLKKSIDKNEGSFLLKYFAQDSLMFGTQGVDSIKGDRLVAIPFEIAPKVFAFDKDYLFILLSKENLEHEGLYVSDPKDYEKISAITKDFEIGSSTDLYKKMHQEIIELFKPIEYKTKVSALDAEIYHELQEPYHRERLIDKTGIPVSELDIEEQVYLISYLKFCDEKSLDRVKKLHTDFGVSGLRTFLSIEHGGKEMGDKILILGEKLPEDSARTLFKTYGEMVDASEEVGTLLAESLGEKATPELIEQTKDSLLVAGKNLLERYAEQSQRCEGEECKDLGQELNDKLSLAKKSVFAFSYACKTLVESGQFSIEDFNKAKLIYDKSPLPKEMQKQIIAMHNENTKQYPEKLKVLWRQTLKDGIEKENSDQIVVSVLYEDDVVSTMRVIKQEDSSWYGASFNVNPTVQGSKVGTELLKRVIEDLAKDKAFVADCYSENPMLKTYLDKFGFKITKEIPNYHDTGALVYQISLFPNRE